MGRQARRHGSPEPFGLEYLGIGNEDLIDDVFKNRFQQIFDAVKAAYRTSSSSARRSRPQRSGFRRLYAREAGLPIVDEHSYQSSSWLVNLDHYDHTGPKVYLGEYGSGTPN